MSTDHPLPAFTSALRGYDRAEVDRYVADLLQAVHAAGDGSNFVADAPADGSRPSGVAGLGVRIDAILAAARGHGGDLVAKSEEEARSLMNTAHEEALDMVGRARLQAEDLTRDATALALRRAEDIVAGAEIEAQGLLDAARAAIRTAQDVAAAEHRRDSERGQREQARAQVIEAAHRAAVDLARTLGTLSGDAAAGPMVRLPDTTVQPAGRARVTSVAFRPGGSSGARPVPIVRQSGAAGTVESAGSFSRQ